MGRPPKSVNILRNEKKSHRPKKELHFREKAEKSLLTGVKIREKECVKHNIIAHKEFMRIQKLLKSIEKDDAIYENVINRYCQLFAECYSLEVERNAIFETVHTLHDAHKEQADDGKISLLDLAKQVNELYSQAASLDKQIQAKREMMFRIEKENLMTIAAAMRSVPKQAPVEDDPHVGMFG